MTQLFHIKQIHRTNMNVLEVTKSAVGLAILLYSEFIPFHMHDRLILVSRSKLM